MHIFILILSSVGFLSLALAPQEKIYLNGTGHNFLELVKYREFLEQARILQPQTDAFRPVALENILPINVNNALDSARKYRVKKAVDEILNLPRERWNKFSRRGFFHCCYAVIMRGFQLDPTNLERIIALARVFRF